MLFSGKTKRMFCFCWLVYFTSYIGRLNFTSSMPSLISLGILDHKQAGIITMAFFITYGSGQLINGYLGDKISPRLMIFFGLFLAGITNCMMSLESTFQSLLFFWGLNGYLQSMIWPPLIRIFAQQFAGKDKEEASIRIVSSLAAGTIVSLLSSAIILRFLSWKWVFLFASGLLCLVALLWFFQYPHVAQPIAKEAREQASSLPWRQGLACLFIPVMIHGAIKDGMTSWIPTYITERFFASPSFSLLLTVLIPCMKLFGASLAELADRHFHGNKSRSIFCFWLADSLFLILFRCAGRWNVLFSTILFALATASVMALNTIYVNIIPLRFQQMGRVAFVSGLLNAIAYLGSALTTFSSGIIVEKWGWDVTVSFWCGMTIMALAFSAVEIHKQY